MIIKFISNFFLLMLEFLSLYFLTKGFLKEFKGNYLRFFFIGIFCIFLDSFLETFFLNTTLTLIIENLLYIALSCLTLPISVFHSIYIYFLEYVFIALCSVMLFPLFGLNGSTIFQGIVPYVGSTIILLLCYLSYHFLPLKKIYSLLQCHNTPFLLILTNTFLLALGFILYARFEPDDFFSHYILFFAFTMSLIFINGEIFINHQKYLREQQQLEIYRSYLPIIENLIEQVRLKQHDYHNHLQTIQGLCYTHNDYESLINALLNTTDHYISESTDFNILKINLHLVAGFLISKIAQFEKQGKILHIHIRTYTLNTSCNEYDLIECLGILVDNALESSSNGDVIYLTIDSTRHHIKFLIENPGPIITPEFTKKIFHSGYTTKSSKEHGIGLHKLQLLIKKNNGNICLKNTMIEGHTYIAFQLTI